MVTKQKFRIAAFGGFRTIPPSSGSAGSDKFAVELYPRIVKRGYKIIAYCRIYPDDKNNKRNSEYNGVHLKYFKTVKKAGFDTLLHSLKCTLDVVFFNRADIIHLHSGANSIWAFILRLVGKKVFISQFAMDWKRDKWPWYGKLFYLFSNYLTAYLPNGVIFDNIFTKKYFENKFKRNYDFIPYGSEVKDPGNNTVILNQLGLVINEYILFVGRFIPDKGVHLLVEAYKKIKTDKKLVIVGGSPNPSDYEKKVKNVSDSRIIFPGYIYGNDTNSLIKNAFMYIQPSLIEGLSPVILTVMGLGTPLICSDIKENKYIIKDNALHFVSGDATSLREKIVFAISNETIIKKKAIKGREDILERFNWETITDQYIDVMTNKRTVKND